MNNCEEVCINCYMDSGLEVHNVNGRCDVCGSLSFEYIGELEKEYE